VKILLICDVTLNDKDAQNIHVIELFNSLVTLSEVSLFVPKPKKIKYNFSNIKYVPWLAIPPLGLISYQISLFFNLYFYCRKKRADAIYVRQSEFSFIPLIISKYFKIPYFVEVNGLILYEMKMFGKSKLNIAVTRLSEKLGYQHAIKIIAVTQGVKKSIMDLYNVSEEKIVVIQNGANIDSFKPLDKDLINTLNLDTSSRYVLFVGNFAPWQGIENLIKSAPSILREYKNVKFLIVGDGIMKKELINITENMGLTDYFIFTGTIPYEEVPLYINASDICVAPFVNKRNKKIGLSPLKIYEYAACGKPIVSSKIPNLEFLEEKEAGILVNPENPEELAEAILTLLNNDELRESMGRNGRDYVVQNHSWQSIGKKVKEICEKVIT